MEGDLAFLGKLSPKIVELMQCSKYRLCILHKCVVVEHFVPAKILVHVIMAALRSLGLTFRLDRFLTGVFRLFDMFRLGKRSAHIPYFLNVETERKPVARVHYICLDILKLQPLKISQKFFCLGQFQWYREVRRGIDLVDSKNFSCCKCCT